jgi:predicted nuclease of restriction endonuclease-like (RecB) superfamily
VDYIKRIFEREGIKTCNGKTVWQATTLQSMLCNEKYKGDAILQKSYTVDFLSKKRAKNQGEIQQFHIEDAEHITYFDTDFMLKTLDYITVFESGKLVVTFMDGTEMEYGWE